MKYRRGLFLIALLPACNSVTVVPIDDEEDAGDASTEATTPIVDAATDAAAASDATDDG